jgi:hypothetical protein
MNHTMNSNSLDYEETAHIKAPSMLRLISPCIHLLPPSDFKDLLLDLTYLEASLIALQHQTSPLQTLGNSMTNSVTLDDLQEQVQKIDTHYGWVLATDFASVSRIFPTTNKNDTKDWLRKIHARYNEICTTLDSPTKYVA